MKKYILILVIGLWAVCFVSGASIDESILERFNGGEDEIRVLIKIKANGVSPRALGFRTMAAEKTSVNRGRVNKEIDGYISSHINRDDLEMLMADNLIESVYVEQTYHTMLQDSIGIMNFTPSWNLESNGLNLTGAGQTVCIIDGGVNYSHSDFGGCTTAEFTAGNCSKVIGGWDFCGNDGDCAVEDNDPMDVEGHGTHVSGIVVANGGIKGTAKGTKIVMMKAANASGVFFSVNVIAAIDRCIANASIFNISVISMSLGGGQYDSYCDGADTGITASINNAVANNISVVVAAGNTDSNYPVATAGISNPACIQNATRVSASTKSDTYASYAFRHSFFRDILMATGGSGSGYINSTDIGGGYGLKIGTSMATPMIAGAIAIINQYLDLSGQTKTPSEVSDILNSTGILLDDSAGSGYNFSRIDVYSALLSLDVDAPNITLVSPADNHINLTVNQTFTCNATDWQLVNMTLRVWNSTGALYYNVTNNITGSSNQTSFNLNEMSEDIYSWNCLGVDNRSNSAYASANFSLTIGGILTTPLTPADLTYTTVNDTNFSCRVISELEHELANMTFYLWNSTGNLTYNETVDISGFDNTTIFNHTFLIEDAYTWNCLGVNNGSNSSLGENNFSITYDVTNPNLTITSSPEGATSNSIARSFGFNVSDTNLANCSLIVNGVISLTNSSINTSVTQTFTQTFTPATYTWNINCSDSAGNVNSSSENGFVITAVPVSPPGGGSNTQSSSSSSTSPSATEVVPHTPNTYDIALDEISPTYTQNLKKDEKVNFTLFDLGGDKHLLTINEIGEDYVNLTIESDPVNLTLGIGQSAKLNLTSPDYYDLFIELNNITNGSAELTIQLINEPIEPEIIVVEKEVEGKDYLWVVIVLVVILALIVFVIVMGKKRSAKKIAEKPEELSLPKVKTKKLKGSKSKKKKNGNDKKTKTKTVSKR